MKKFKEHAKRVALLIGALGIVFSSVAYVFVIFAQNKDSSTTQTDIQKQIQEQIKQQEIKRKAHEEKHKNDPDPNYPVPSYGG